MTKTMSRYALVREEDYWLIPIFAFTILFGAFAVYASVFSIRVPAVILFCLGVLFTAIKIRSGYSINRAKVYFVATILLSLLLALFMYLLTK